MIFGDQVEAPDSSTPAGWVEQGCNGSLGTVAALVPNGYRSFLRVHAPEAESDDWKSDYRDLFAAVVEVGIAHTRTPDTAWFAIWEGHGFDQVNRNIASMGQLDDHGRRRLEAERARLRVQNERETTAIRSALGEIPKFTLPHRDYYLVSGPVEAATELRDPSSPTNWQHPDLFWPDDRRWFVATDVDFWSLYIGGDDAFTAHVARNVATPTEIVGLDFQLEVEN